MSMGCFVRKLRVAVALGSVLVAATPSNALAEVFTAGPSDGIDNIEATINALEPGDELVLSGGTYTLEGRFSFSIAGTEDQPIVIRAAEGEAVHFHRPNANQNIIDIDDAEHVVIRGIEFSGGSAGIRVSGARFLTIEECEIHDTGDVALRANDTGVTYESLRILRNHIHHTNNTGEGMYLGCNNAACEVVDSLIEGNYVHHTNQQSVTQGDGIELKEGSAGNFIRDNVIHDTNYPCILTYASNGAPNVIERNLLWGCGDHAIQSAADATIRNNIILSAGSDGIAMQAHQSGSPSQLVVVHNTVLHANGDAMSLRGISGSVTIANNALYSQTGAAFYANGTSGLVFEGNVGAGTSTLPLAAGNLGVDFLGASYVGAPPMDVFPAPNGALRASGDAAYVPADDFNGTARDGVADVGAYALRGEGNPGWPLSAGFKAVAGVIGPGSGGMSGSGGAGGRGGAWGDAGEPREPFVDGDPGRVGGSGCAVGAVGSSRFDLPWLLLALATLVRRRRH